MGPASDDEVPNFLMEVSSDEEKEGRKRRHRRNKKKSSFECDNQKELKKRKD